MLRFISAVIDLWYVNKTPTYKHKIFSLFSKFCTSVGVVNWFNGQTFILFVKNSTPIEIVKCSTEL